MAGILDGLNKAVSKLTDMGKSVLDKTDIDEKIVETAKGLKDKAQQALDKTDIDEKIVETAKGAVEKGKEAVSAAAEKVAAVKGSVPEAPKDAMGQIKDEVSAQVEQIRSATTGSDPIHDYIQNKYHAEEKPAEPEPQKPDTLQDAVEQARAAAEKANDAAEMVQSAVDAKLQNISDRAKAAYEEARDTVAAKAQEIVDGVKGEISETAEAAQAADVAPEILEGPTADTLAEVFETAAPEAPEHFEPHAD